MKQFNNDAKIRADTIAAIQYNIDKYSTDLECYRQKLRILDSEIGTELFSKKPVEYRNDVESITARIIETKKELEKSNESLSNLYEAKEEK
jgi:hypothetical protein